MANNKSLGAVQVIGNTPVEINAALLALCQRIDESRGLRGRGVIHDRVGVGAPTVSGDAARLGDIPGVTGFVVMGSTAAENLVDDGRVLRFVDENGTLIHAIGTIE